MHSAPRRLVALLVAVVPVSVAGLAGVTWGAGRPESVPEREARIVTVSEAATERDRDERVESAVVLVVLDGIRWQEVFNGADRGLAGGRGYEPPAWSNARALMPNLHHIIDTHGVAVGAPGRGPEMVATGPHFISLPGYLEIFTGHADSACWSNGCSRTPARTIADDVRDSSGPDDVAIVSSWPTIARAVSADSSDLVLTSGRKIESRAELLHADDAVSELLERGERASAWPGEGDYRPDSLTERIALRHLTTARPRFLFVGLGDADEYAHRSDYRGYLHALHRNDEFLGDLTAALGEMGERGRHTTVIVTTDHGRARDFRDHGWRYPESGRVWLVAAGDDVRGRGVVAASRKYTLSDVAPTVRALLGIASGEGEPIAEIVGR